MGLEQQFELDFVPSFDALTQAAAAVPFPWGEPGKIYDHNQFAWVVEYGEWNATHGYVFNLLITWPMERKMTKGDFEKAVKWIKKVADEAQMELLHVGLERNTAYTVSTKWEIRGTLVLKDGR